MNNYNPNPFDCFLQQSSYTEQYKLITESTLMMGVKNPPVKTTIEAEVDYMQTMENKGFITSIEVMNLRATCSNPAMSNSLEELYVVSGINPRLVVRRNRSGKVKEIENMNEMENEWQNWKENKLASFIPNIRKQEKFIDNYERGMDQLRYRIEQNFQYILLFPECYRFKDYASIEDRSMGRIYNSRFIEDMHIPYQLVKESYEETVEGIKISMVSLIVDGVKLHPKSFYKKNLPDFSVEEYDFSVRTEYLFEKDTSRIIHGKLTFREMLHPNFYYNLDISMITM